MDNEFKKDTVIGVLKHQRDLPLAIHEKWYRIPVKSAPVLVRENKVKYLAFYQGKIFKDSPSQIQWYGKVKNISVHKRVELLPEETLHPNAHEDYFKINLAEVFKLPSPVVAVRPRRIHFIITQVERLLSAKEINDVFLESPIEEMFWEALKSEKIDAERQYIEEYETKKKRKFFHLDFAVFCKSRNIDLECNGDEYHHKRENDIIKDKSRNRILTSKGWAIMRYTRDEIVNTLKQCLDELIKTIDKYGGLQDKFDPNKYRYLSKGSQLRLF